MNPSNSPSAHSLPYRPDLDGLRALAVIAVVCFHASLGFPGGYVGVDVFFVISGYLITSLILRDLRAGKFSLKDFFERRVRRILPALYVMVAVTLLIGGGLFLPGAYDQLGISAVAQAVMMANVFFWWDDRMQGGYFGPVSEERPLLHTWSLSVEEQFYLVFPLLLVWLFRFERWRSPRALSRLLFGGLVLGLVLAIYGTNKSQQAAFYLLPTRAWELLCGAWIAALPAGGVARGRFVRESASWIGLAGILLPYFLYSKETSFPGMAALPPCVGAALLIWSSADERRGERSGTLIGHTLALRPFVFIGMISYSFYLWHWPLLVFGRYWFLAPELPWHYRVGLVMLAGLLAVASWKWVERPFREKRVAATRPAIFRFAGVAVMLSALAGAGISASGGLPSRIPQSIMQDVAQNIAQNAATEMDKLEYVKLDVEVDDIAHDKLPVLGEDTGDVKILLWGDSHAMHSIPAMDDFCREAGIKGCAAVRGVNPPLINATYGNVKERNPEFAAAVMEYIRRHRVKDVVLAARWCHYEGMDAERLEQALTHTIQALHENSCRIWVLQDVPDVDIMAAKPLIRAALRRFEDPS